MSDVVHYLRDFQIILFVRFIGFARSQIFCFACVVFTPLAQTFDDFFHGSVVVTTAHAQNAITASFTHGFCDFFVAQFQDAVKAVLQRHVIVHNFTALRDCEGVEHNQNAVHDVLELFKAGKCFCIFCGNVFYGNAVPVFGYFYQNRNVFFPHTKFFRNGDDFAIAFCNVAATGANNRNGVSFVFSKRFCFFHEGFRKGIEEACTNPREREGTTQMFCLVHDKFFIRQNGRCAVCQRSSNGFCTAYFQQIAVIFPPYTVVPVGTFHICCYFQQIIDVHDTLEALSGSGNILLLHFL